MKCVPINTFSVGQAIYLTWKTASPEEIVHFKKHVNHYAKKIDEINPLYKHAHLNFYDELNRLGLLREFYFKFVYEVLPQSNS